MCCHHGLRKNIFGLLSGTDQRATLEDYSRSEARTCLQMEWKEMGWDVEVTAVVTAKRPLARLFVVGE